MTGDRRTGTEHVAHRIATFRNPGGLVLVAHFPYGDTETLYLTDADDIKGIAHRHRAAGATVAMYDGNHGRCVMLLQARGAA